MSDKNLGKVVPFALSARRMRQGAETYRRRGQLVEAVELTRRAAQEDDSALGWLHLAEQLRQAGCYEQAVAILYRVLAGEEIPPDAWLELARCQQAMGQTDSAVDSLYHYLQEDPYSDAADTARAMLGELEPEEEVQEIIRLPHLIRRGLTAWKNGQREQGIARLKRAARLAYNPARIHATMALMHMAERRFDDALRALSSALQANPEDPKAKCMVCVALYGAGKKRVALGMLRQCAALCDSPAAEDAYIAAAQTLSARRELSDYLHIRLRHQPYRIALMHAMAGMALEAGRYDQAMQWWQRILRLDPADLKARMLLQWRREHPDDSMEHVGAFIWDKINGLFVEAAAHLSAAEPPAEKEYLPGSDLRSMLDWFFCQPDETLQLCAAELLAELDSPSLRRYWKELLLFSAVGQSVRQQILLLLIQRGECGPFQVRVGPHITSAQCTPLSRERRSLWKLFLQQLLLEASGSVNGLVDCAARIWRIMTPKEHMRAATSDSYTWVKAVMIWHLREENQEEAAARAALKTPISTRRISRILRCLARRLGADTPLVRPDKKV